MIVGSSAGSKLRLELRQLRRRRRSITFQFAIATSVGVTCERQTNIVMPIR